MTKSTVIAMGCQVACAGYLQLVEWVDLFPWNDLSRGNAQEILDFVLLGCQALIVVFYASRRLWLMGLGWLAYACWLYLQIVSWWQPYLFGGRVVGPNWYFAKTYKILPAIDQRPTPDANHMVLQILLVAILVSGAIAIRRSWVASRCGRKAALGAATSAVDT